MKGCCRRFCCLIFCCQCTKTSALKLIDENTKLLPKNQENNNIIEREELHAYGAIPEPLLSITELSRISNSSIKKISSGNNHSLIWFNDGTLYGFGGNEEGQLGISWDDESKKYINTLTKLSFKLQNTPTFTIEDIAAGDTFSLILIKHNDQYDIVKFGISVEEKYKVNLTTVPVIHLEDIPNKIKNIQISKISAFGRRKIFITQDNDLYLGGLDFKSIEMDSYYLINHFPSKILSVNLGMSFCILLDDKGVVYGLGDNTYGEWGCNITSLEQFVNCYFKEFSVPIKKISCGARHTLFLLTNGELYCVGDNSEGQCFGFSDRVNTPIKMELEGVAKVIDCYSGYTHNLIVVENGDALTWGDAAGGKLGNNEEFLSRKTPKTLLQWKQKNLSAVCWGFQSTLIVTGSFERSILAKNAIK